MSAELLQDGSLRGEHADLLQTIDKSGHTLHALIDNLLDFSKAESGKLVLESAAFNLQQLLRDAVEQASSLAVASNNKTVLSLPHKGLPTVCGDSLRLRQILINLIGNAHKFCTNGTVEVKASRLSPADWDSQLAAFQLSSSDGFALEPDSKESTNEGQRGNAAQCDIF